MLFLLNLIREFKFDFYIYIKIIIYICEFCLSFLIIYKSIKILLAFIVL